MRIQIDEIQKQMEELLPRKRYLHTQGVSYMAACLAMCYKEDVNRTMIAGLLHDNAKYIDYMTAIAECEKNELTLSRIERENPFLIHGKLGAFYAKTKYGVEDEEILSAITYHTTGKPEMTLLEKIIFLSDYIEPGRTQPTIPSLEEIRTVAFHDLDLAVYYAADNTVRYIQSQGTPLDELTVFTRDYYKNATS